MHKTIHFILSVALLLVTIPLSAQNKKGNLHRVKFERGSASTIIKGAIRNWSEDVYMLEARQGQTMIVNLRPVPRDADMTLNIEAPNGKSLNDSDSGWMGKLPQSGDYKIYITTINSKTARFTLEVTIK